MIIKNIIKDYLSTSIILMSIFLLQLFMVTLMVMVALAQYSVKFAMCLEQMSR